MKHFLYILGVTLWLTSPVMSQGAAPSSGSANSPVAPMHVGKEAELSAKLRAVDSLDVLPEDSDASHDGGTRRDRLESSVFRREKPVDYESGGRRDPFRALIVDEKKSGSEEIETELLKLEGAILTGVVWAEGQYLALVKDKAGRNFFLREGDPIYQGHVTLVTQSQASFEISDFGDYQKVVLKVRVKDKDSDKAKDKG